MDPCVASSILVVPTTHSYVGYPRHLLAQAKRAFFFLYLSAHRRKGLIKQISHCVLAEVPIIPVYSWQYPPVGYKVLKAMLWGHKFKRWNFFYKNIKARNQGGDPGSSLARGAPRDVAIFMMALQVEIVRMTLISEGS